MTDSPRSREREIRLALYALTLALAGLHFVLIFRLNINWDEFRFLADIHRMRAGTLTSALQTLHVHLFGWLTEVGANEIDQVIAGRGVYYALLLGSCGWLFLIARQFVTSVSALFVVLCYLSYAEVIAHATSFRFDGLSAFLLLGSLALVTQGRAPRTTAIAAGGLISVALLVTMKSVFYLPAVALVLLLRGGSEYRTARLRDLLYLLLSMAAGTAILYALHRMSLPAVAVAEPADQIRQAGDRFIRFDQLFPGRMYLLATIVGNAVIWFFLLFGVRSVVRRLRGGEARPEALRLLALLTPLVSLVFYRNAFPYFYAFVMPSALVLTGVWFEQHLQRYRANLGRPRPILVIAIAAVVASFMIHYVPRLSDETAVQRQIVEAVHRIFPQPVPYIDRNSMIASFPKVGFFMSTAGFQSYFDRGPVFRDLIGQEGPRFLLANHPALILDPTVTAPQVPGTPRLYEEDFQILRDNFVPHWGPIYVAGKRLVVGDADSERFELLIPGVYAVEAQAPLIIADRTYAPGDTVHLGPGIYQARSGGGDQEVILRLGVNLHRPAEPPLTGPLYRDF